MFDELDFKDIKAIGWARDYLLNQKDGLTGHIHEVGEPFSLKTWEQKENPKPEQAFLGGINSIDDSWVPFEQNGYWIDGLIRCGRLLDDDYLINLAKSKIYPSIMNADDDGFIGPHFMKNKLSWPHAVYFRSFICEYTATKDERILDALKRHFLRRPLKDAFLNKDLRIISVRNVADIEIALWLYKETKDQRFLQMSIESYDTFNRMFQDDKEASLIDKMHDITLKGMKSNAKVRNNHGVTYCEICKLAAILYKYTGNNEYKKAAIKAFDKAYRDNMIVDGVISSSEYLNGNESSHAMHETCVVSDFTWALGYLFMITGDSKYGDWIENAIFNAGLGSVDDDFRGEQYFS